ncbi:hypothetical protein [Pseudopelagicola sp. nBUS_19]|uniref:hypothetical protein n=1 Tax=Pseudopelagicola sp. nBUS_19 TaxID=3395316 RepID=UPI003EBE9810
MNVRFGEIDQSKLRSLECRLRAVFTGGGAIGLARYCDGSNGRNEPTVIYAARRTDDRELCKAAFDGVGTWPIQFFGSSEGSMVQPPEVVIHSFDQDI